MKTNLLKRIRRDKRFLLEHRGFVEGFPYSGWWYCVDQKLKRSVNHKRLKNVLDWLVKVYVMKFWIKAVSYSLLSFFLIIFIIHIIQKLNP